MKHRLQPGNTSMVFYSMKVILKHHSFLLYNKLLSAFKNDISYNRFVIREKDIYM